MAEVERAWPARQGGHGDQSRSSRSDTGGVQEFAGAGGGALGAPTGGLWTSVGGSVGTAGAAGVSILHPTAAVEGSALDGGAIWASAGDSGDHAADGGERGHALADPSAAQVRGLRVSSVLQRRLGSVSIESQIGPFGEQKDICETAHSDELKSKRERVK